ncbi:MAG: V-type ATPase subunit [Spirochaetaceae bacterium]|nr:V-type ATPase subunit [Spirochaetaceae bacterium]
MSDYDYLNARVRAMAARLLPRGLIEQIVSAEGEEIFVDLLMDSDYADSLSEVMASSRESGAAESALKLNLFDRLRKLRAIAPEGPRRLVEAQLGLWDLRNAIAIARGLRRRAPPSEIARVTVPAGTIHPTRLALLAEESDERAMFDTLSTWGVSCAPAFGEALRRAAGGTDAADFERELLVGYFARVLGELDPDNPDEAILIGQLRLEIDLANVVAALKCADARSRGAAAAAAAAAAAIASPPIPGGQLGERALERIALARDLLGALELLEGTAFGPPVQRGLIYYVQSGRLGSIERFLEGVVLEAGAALSRGDRLSAGVPLGYIWRKVGEFLNLRAILRGKRYGMPAAAIRETLVLA